MEPRVSLPLRRRRGQTVPAETLAAEAGLSPKPLAAAIEELTRRGFAIESHPLMGFRLIWPPPSLLEEEVAGGLGVARVGRRVRCLEVVSSTNDLAWEAAGAGQGAADGLAIFAEYQSAGRGRRGNVWLAPPHSSLLGSVVLWVADAAGQAAVLTRAAAVAVAEAIEEQCGLTVGIKWPNDLVVDDLKVAGILVESRPKGGEAGPVVIGVGINCAQRPEDFPPELRSHAASLTMVAEDVDRTLLARSLLERLDGVVALMGFDEGIAQIRRKAAARCRTLGSHIMVSEGDKTWSGEVIDLDPDYELVLRLPQGGIRRFAAMTTQVLSSADQAG